MKKLSLLTFSIWLIGHSLVAQGTIDDYNRAFSLQDKFKDKVFYSNVTPQWIAKSNCFWYVRVSPQGKTYLLVDAKKKTKITLFDHIKLAEKLSKASKKTVDMEKMTLSELKVSASFDTLHFVNAGIKWTYLQKSDSLINDGKQTFPKSEYWGKVDTERTGEPVLSPDKKLSAFVKENNLYIKDLKTGIEKAISTDGIKNDYYSAYPYWSPDSKKIAIMCIHAAETRQLTLIESSPTDQLQPKLQTRDYVKPGDILPQRTPVIFDINTGDKKVGSTELCKNQMALPGFEWLPDSKSVVFEYNERGHKVYRILEMSAETGNIKTLIEETSNTFVNYTRYFRQNLNKTNEIIWMSERDNWNHLYLYNRLTGTVKNQITVDNLVFALITRGSRRELFVVPITDFTF